MTSDNENMTVDTQDDPQDEENDEEEGRTPPTDTAPQSKKSTAPSEKEKAAVVVVKEKKDWSQWPLRSIKDPHDNDVMYGRGGGTNHHPGNKRYRKLVEERKVDYINSKRLDKPLVALDIIRIWRAQEPPGRFLKLDEKTGLWHDVGDKKAREKTSQALREKAPLIRKQQEEKELGVGDDGKGNSPKSPKDSKTTRFAEGTKSESKNVKKPVLARDHSLGRELMADGEKMSLEGFSWQDPFQTGGDPNRATSFGSMSSLGPPAPVHPGASPPAPEAIYGPTASGGRTNSHGSVRHYSGGHPPPPDYYGRVASGDERGRHFSNSRYESWGSMGSWSSFPPYPQAPGPHPPPPTPPPGHYPHHQRSGSWTHAPPPPLPSYGPGHHQRSGSWSNNGRDHSLALNPLVHGNPAQAAAPFDASARAGSSGYWRGGEAAYAAAPPPLPAPPGAYNMPPPPSGTMAPPPNRSGGAPMGPYRDTSSLSPYRQGRSPGSTGTPSPSANYNVDLQIAKSWSGGEVRRTWSREDASPRNHDTLIPTSGRTTSPQRDPTSSSPPKPQMVKRDTSHQNESTETKHSVKRAALNRDQSATSNRLKQEYMPSLFPAKRTEGSEEQPLRFDVDKEMRMLSDNLEETNLKEPATPSGVRPTSLRDGDRVSTVDKIAMELMVKPAPLLDSNRSSTIEALDLDLDDDDPLIKSGEIGDGKSRAETIQDLKKDLLPRPKPLKDDQRLTTMDFLDIVNEPLVEEEDSDMNAGGATIVLKEGSTIVTEWMAQV